MHTFFDRCLALTFESLFALTKLRLIFQMFVAYRTWIRILVPYCPSSSGCTAYNRAGRTFGWWSWTTFCPGWCACTSNTTWRGPPTSDGPLKRAGKGEAHFQRPWFHAGHTRGSHAGYRHIQRSGQDVTERLFGKFSIVCCCLERTSHSEPILMCFWCIGLGKL